MAAYDPHEGFVAPARPASALIQTAAGFLAIEFLFGLGRSGLVWIAAGISPGFAQVLVARATGAAILIDLFSFALLAALVIWVARRNHDRGARSLIGPSALARQDFPRALGGALLILLAIELVLFAPAESGADMQSLPGWLLLLPVSAAALLVQTGAEELFYRGYLQQQLAARFSQRWIWLVVPNLIFASVHWYADQGHAASVRYVVWAFFFGLAASDLVARSGSLGAAVGFHMANNIFAFLVVGEAGAPDSGLALFLLPPRVVPGEGAAAPAEPILGLAIGVDLFLVLLLWLAVRVAIRR
ncbi:CAAX amino terminal protease family protein [Pseudooceanicola batsensis HTCC2597]|uniref:CAAX amino terminal protease family protein n=1 Tax=Pseudooceanicola batsensis (strain ATCC BAA-863 / DSM 15984 / KCTC 12145 / HTCC2597) TaxID=252305 RepID=A3TVU3_PSEBH|nr:CPBP family intramembrane glutamic endopeptidase [Pseudooceanicola batsensis]EAQ03739.1 CAAX amino terminal protease family protein [Pseudooceanicola batsensis HTCC2597]